MGSRFPPYTKKGLATFKKLLYPSMPPRGGPSGSGWRIGSWLSSLLLCVALAVGVAAPDSRLNLILFVRNLFYSGK